MALARNASAAAAKFANLSIPRQLGLVVALAATIALGMGVAMWSRDPSYMPLYNQISPRDAVDIIEVLQHNNINFKVNQNTGAVLVATDQVQTARMKLATEGLPRGNDTGGFDLFAGSNAFNSSQFMENARYKKALESELVRTISQFHDIKGARVHLAIPRESAFVRDNREPSASVFLDVYSRMPLKKQTVAAIINLVASSIPNLSASKVTVVDQNGQLLNEGGGQNTFTDTERYLDYRENMEQQYAQKVQDILTPILGYGRVKAKVSADIDFTAYEQTQELFDPKNKVLRSEQMMEETHKNAPEPVGVPGATSNQAQPNLPAKAQSATQTAPDGTHDSRKQSTKNFELDKTISHTKKQPGTIKRLSVAVVVDNHSVTDPKTKKTTSKPLTKQEIEQIKTLVSDALGIDIKRGDSLNVINSDFVKPEPIESQPEEKFWKTDFFWSIIKQVSGALFILILVFGILRPLFKSLASSKVNVNTDDNNSPDDQLIYENKAAALGTPSDYEAQLTLLRQIVDKEPKRVAQVVKTWIDQG